MFRLAVLSPGGRAVVALAAVGVMAAGLLAAGGWRRDVDYSWERPTVVVSVAYPGAGPEAVHDQVTTLVEARGRDLPGVVSWTSSATVGLSLTVFELSPDLDLDQAAAQLETRLGQAGLPATTTVTAVPGDLGRQPLRLTVSGRGGLVVDPDSTSRLAASAVVAPLSALPQVADVELSGFYRSVVTLRPNAEAMALYGLTNQQIMSVLSHNGLIVPTTAVTADDQSWPVQLGAPVTTLDQLKALVVGYIPPQAQPPPEPTRNDPSPAPQPDTPAIVVTLEMVAETTYAPEPTAAQARLCLSSQVPICSWAVIIAVDGSAATDPRDLSQAVATVLAKAQQRLADYDLEAEIVFDPATFITQETDRLVLIGGLTLVAALVMVGLGLRSGRLALVALAALPAIPLAAVAGLRLSGASATLITLGALVVGLARGIDDVIVVLDSVKRQLVAGGDRREAVSRAVRQVAGPLITATVATWAALVALGLALSGTPAQALRQFAWTVAGTMVLSLVVALVVTPVWAHWFLPALPAGRPQSESQSESARSDQSESAQSESAQSDRSRPQRTGSGQPFAGWRKTYLKLLRSPAGRRAVVVLTVVAAAATIWLGRGIAPSATLPSDPATQTVSLVFPPNTTRAVQVEEAERAGEALAALEGVDWVQVVAGGDDAASRSATGWATARLTLTVEPAADWSERIVAALDGVVRLGAPVVPGGSLADQPTTVDVVVSAEDQTLLDEVARQLETTLKSLSEAGSVTNSLDPSLSVVEVKVDRAKAAAVGLTESQISQLVASAGGAATIGQIDRGGDPITVKVAWGVPPTTLDDLLAWPLGVGPEGVVTLGAVAEVITVQSPAVITSSAVGRVGVIALTPLSPDGEALARQVVEVLAQSEFPAGVEVGLAGLGRLPGSGLSGLGWAAALALGLVYLVWAGAARSWRRPLLLLATSPAAGLGAVLGLRLSGQPLGPAAGVGCLLLALIVVAEAIVWTGLADRDRVGSGRTSPRAVEAGIAHRRPFRLTALSLVLVLAPLAGGAFGPQTLWLRPTALVLLAGLVSATLWLGLTVPVLHRLDERWTRRRGADQGRSPGSAEVELSPVQAGAEQWSDRDEAERWPGQAGAERWPQGPAEWGQPVSAKEAGRRSGDGAVGDGARTPGEAARWPAGPLGATAGGWSGGDFDEVAGEWSDEAGDWWTEIAPAPTATALAGAALADVAPDDWSQELADWPGAVGGGEGRDVETTRPGGLGGVSAASETASATPAAWPGEAGGRFRPPLFPPDEPAGVSTAERLVAEWQRVRAVEQTADHTGRLRPPLFAPEDITPPPLRRDDWQRLSAAPEAEATPPGGGAARPVEGMAAAETGAVGSSGGSMADGGAAAPVEDGLGAGTGVTAVGASGGAARGGGVSPPGEAEAVRAGGGVSEAGAAWLAGSDAARRDDSQPATRPVRSRPAAPRPGPSGRTKATPGRTLWPEPGPTADSLRDVESDPAGAAPAPVAVPFDPFSQASPRGLSPADRQALALSAAIPVAAAVAPATEVEPPAARTGGPASVETVPAEPPAAETEPPAAAEAVSPPTAPPFPGQSDVGSPGPFSGDVDEPGPATSWPTWSSLD